MSKNIPEIPFAELVERVASMARIGENSAYKVREAVNEVYTHEIPYKYDWIFMYATSSFQSVAEYKVGTASVNTGSTAVTLSSDATMSADMVGRKMKFSTNPTVYTINAYTSATSIGLLESFQGDSNVSSGSYSIFQDTYALADDFDRFPKDGGLYKWSGGKKQILKEESYQDNTKNFQASPADPDRCRLAGANTLGTQLVSLRPAPVSLKNYGYDYVKRLSPMEMSTAGTVIVNNGNSTITGSSTKFTEVTTGAWFRINDDGENQDSRWYRINAISHDSSLTLNETYKGNSGSAKSYTVSESPDMPIRMQPAILWGALRNLTVDQNDPNAQYYHIKLSETLSDGKRLYVSRQYSTEFHTIAEEYRYRY